MPENEKTYLDIQDIMNCIPHRYPFLLVDRVTEIRENGGKGYRNITINDSFFQGHFPEKPVYPGVLIIEGMAQCAGVIAAKILEKQNQSTKNKLIFFATINNVKFREIVKPGDQLVYDIEIPQLTPSRGKFIGKALVDGKVVCEAEMMAVMRDKE